MARACSTARASRPYDRAVEALDAIVIGVGSMGASTCMQLAKRGARVLGIERFSIPHDGGSHHGGSRIIRDCYFEHPSYVPLLLRCGTLWQVLEADCAHIAARSACGAPAPIVHRPGVLYLGPAGSEVVEQSAASGARHSVPCEQLSGTQLRERFPQFAIPAGWNALFEPGAGFVRPERAVAAWAHVARAHGAQIHDHERVLEWHETATGVRVKTDRRSYDARRLILTAGAWTPALAAQLGVPLTPLRVVIAWLTPREPAPCVAPRMPVWYIDRGAGLPGIYGIPTAPDQGCPAGVKIALHGNGTPCDPDAPRVPPSDLELAEIHALAAQFVPCCAGPASASSTCLYTMSPDAHFIVDRMPQCEHTYIAAGFSGHGFKFAPVLGEALADLAMTGATDLPIAFLSKMRRASSTDFPQQRAAAENR